MQRWVAASGLVREGEDEGAAAGEPIVATGEASGGTIGGGRKAIGVAKRRLSISGMRARGGSGSQPQVQETLSEEIRRLRRELDEARLYGRLMEAMIEIAEEEFEIPIRKKSGAKPRSCWGNSH